MLLQVPSELKQTAFRFQDYERNAFTNHQSIPVQQCPYQVMSVDEHPNEGWVMLILAPVGISKCVVQDGCYPH